MSNLIKKEKLLLEILSDIVDIMDSDVGDKDYIRTKIEELKEQLEYASI